MFKESNLLQNNNGMTRHFYSDLMTKNCAQYNTISDVIQRYYCL